ncbi:MAG: proteasome-activating nucleotidase [Candidatus Thorarchaeota archaeon]|nr:proteasome-activating nucleotidase [Candidatus Thorarchaeota archaeon]
MRCHLLPGTTDAKDEGSVDDSTYSQSYTRHLERRLRALETEKQILQAERSRLEKETQTLRTELEKLRQSPLITATIIELLDDGRAIVKSSTGPNFVVHVASSIPQEKLQPGALVALNQRSFAITQELPPSRDPLIRAMEIEDAPDVSYTDIGGLRNQLQEIRETVELPLLEPELFEQVGIEPPKGVLLTGLPGTGKTLCARAVAHETNATFIRVIGSELVQKFIGEGARLVREIFMLAKEKAPAIIFVDELDAVGSHRLDIATSGDREVQRTLMQLLSELDGFEARGQVAVLGATNRPDILDPALLRPGRFDRIIEFPLPDETSRREIFKIHTRGMNIEKKIDFDRLLSITQDRTGADIKSICTEAGMFAIREKRVCVTQEDFQKAISKVQERGGTDNAPSSMYC